MFLNTKVLNKHGKIAPFLFVWNRLYTIFTVLEHVYVSTK